MKMFLPVSIAVGLIVATAGRCDAELLVHYTFDAEEVNGSTIFDVAGHNNNASRIGNVEFGVPGVLGDAIRLPNDDGASYVQLPSLTNPTPNGNDARTIAYWFSQETAGVENKMFGYGSGAVGASFDVSLEGGGIRLRYSGGNITWGSGFDFTGADAGFHHLAIRVPEAAFDYLDVDVFLDGQLLTGNPTAGNPANTPINTGGGQATELNIGRSPTFSPAGDYIGLIDDFRIYNTALSDVEIGDLAGSIESLILQVDPATGAVAIVNPIDDAVAIDYYEITSESSSLTSGAWVPLEVQDRDDFPAGNGNGDGWETLGPATSARVSEGRLVGASTIDHDGWVGLGNLSSGVDPGNLTFVYREDDTFRTGRVELVASGIEGDYNRDGRVDAADYALWRDHQGSRVVLATDSTPGVVNEVDYAVWRSAYGSPTTVSIPEPASLALIVVAMGFGRMRPTC